MIESGLAAIGVDKSDLVLAWDFVTRPTSSCAAI